MPLPTISDIKTLDFAYDGVVLCRVPGKTLPTDTKSLDYALEARPFVVVAGVGTVTQTISYTCTSNYSAIKSISKFISYVSSSLCSKSGQSVVVCTYAMSVSAVKSLRAGIVRSYSKALSLTKRRDLSLKVPFTCISVYEANEILTKILTFSSTSVPNCFKSILMRITYLPNSLYKFGASIHKTFEVTSKRYYTLAKPPITTIKKNVKIRMVLAIKKVRGLF